MVKNKLTRDIEVWEGYTVYYSKGSTNPNLRDPMGNLVDWYTRQPLGIVVTNEEYQNQRAEMAREEKAARERLPKNKIINLFLNSATFPNAEYSGLVVGVPVPRTRTIAEEVEALERML